MDRRTKFVKSILDTLARQKLEVLDNEEREILKKYQTAIDAKKADVTRGEIYGEGITGSSGG